MRPLRFLVGSLLLIHCAYSSVGRPCQVDGQCDPGQICFTGVANGACSEGCSEEGISRDCPSGTVCARNDGQLLCSAACASAAECRPGYSCDKVPNSPTRACVP